MSYFRNRSREPRKQRPQTRYSIQFVWGEDGCNEAYTEDDIPIKTIYVGNLSSKITANRVKQYFLEFGSVASVAIKRAGSKRAPWFYAFVTFAKTGSAAKALGVAKHEILSRRVVVNAADSWIQPRKKEEKCERNKESIDETSEMGLSLLHLNDDCLCHIASFLKPHDLLNLSKTCKRLEFCILASCKKLYIESLRGLTLMQIREILYKIGPHVQHIVCSDDFELNGRRFEELLKKYCVNIVSLEFDRACSLSKRLIQTFKNLKTVKCPVTDDMSVALSKCSNLQNLYIDTGKNFTGKHLDKLSNLQNLNLFRCSNLQPEFFKNFCMKTKLVSLNIVGCRLLDYSSIETLASTQTRLENLLISNNYRTSNLTPLATLKNLKRLRIDCLHETCDEFFQELAKHRGAELEMLVIWRCPFNQKVEQAIFSLKNLKVLAFNDCENITSPFFTKLTMTSLECLIIFPLKAFVEEGILDLISISKTIKVIAGSTFRDVDKRPLVLNAYEIIKKKERKYPFSLLTSSSPFILDGILHDDPKFKPASQFRKIIKRFEYLEALIFISFNIK